mgnify:CR=1 FL=1
MTCLKEGSQKLGQRSLDLEKSVAERRLSSSKRGGERGREKWGKWGT